MNALRLDGHEPKLMSIAPAPLPDGWARVAVRRAGVCGTDLQIVAGYAGFQGTLGHEFVGEVVEGSEAWVGRRVVGEINVGCDDCPACATAGPNHCENRRVLGIRGLDGAFAETLVLPEINLHAVPRDVDDATAVFTEPLAAACDALDRLPEGADRVLVIGAGRLGQLVARVLHAAGRAVTALDRNAPKRAQLEALGIATIAAAPASTWPAVVECSGSAAGLGIAVDATRSRGTVVLKSTRPGLGDFDATQAVVRELRVVGSRCGRFAPALDLLAAERVRVSDLLDATYPLAEAERALAHAARPGALKVHLEV